MAPFAFERTADLALIHSIITSDRRIYDAMADDTCPAMEDFQLPEDPAIWYVVVREEGKLLGFWGLIPQGETCAEVHTCLLPCAGFSAGRSAARAMAQWIWDNTPFTWLTTKVPAFNRAALMFAKAAEMKEVTVDKERYLKNGTLHDLFNLEMHKPEGI